MQTFFRHANLSALDIQFFHINPSHVVDVFHHDLSHVTVNRQRLTCLRSSLPFSFLPVGVCPARKSAMIAII